MRALVKPSSTHILRGAVSLIGLIVLALCVFVLPPVLSEPGAYRPVIIGMYVAAVPFYIALYQTLQLLGYIDRNHTFSGASVQALERIKYCAIAISALYAAGSPLLYIAAQADD